MKTKEIKTEILINSTPQKVWSVLLDFSNYPFWNPFIQAVRGRLQLGKNIKIRLRFPGNNTEIWIKSKVNVLEAHKELRWMGRFMLPGLFDGEHTFELVSNENGTTTFRQSEQFKGILVPFFQQMLDKSTIDGFRLMNEKLKERVEKVTNKNIAPNGQSKHLSFFSTTN
jgi:hypothetical protein